MRSSRRRNVPNGGCALATVLFMAVVWLLILPAIVSCSKDECIKPITAPSKDKICMGCMPKTRLDTTLRKSN